MSPRRPGSAVTASATPFAGTKILNGRRTGPRFLLADAHGIVRQGLRTVLRRVFKHASFIETETSVATVATAQRGKCHLIILALGLPDRKALHAVARLRCAAAPVLVFTLYSEEQMGVAAIEAGAKGYLCKTASDAEILTAVRTLLAGREYITPHLRELLARHLTHPSPIAGSVPLSARERAVLREFHTGGTVKEIAAHLDLAASTVSTYRGRILRKLGLRTTNELLRYLADRP